MGEAVKKFKSLHEQMNEQVEEMKELIRNTGMPWEETEAEDFEKRFWQLVSDMGKMKGMVSEHINDMWKMATVEFIPEADESDISGLRGDVIV